MSTDGKPLETAEAKATYLQRTQRVKDIIGLQKPDRVPLLPFMGAFFAQYDGITPHDVMYDYDEIHPRLAQVQHGVSTRLPGVFRRVQSGQGL